MTRRGAVLDAGDAAELFATNAHLRDENARLVGEVARLEGALRDAHRFLGALIVEEGGEVALPKSALLHDYTITRSEDVIGKCIVFGAALASSGERAEGSQPQPEQPEVTCAACGADISGYLKSSDCFKNRECLACFNKRVNGPDRPPGPPTPPNPGIRWHG